MTSSWKRRNTHFATPVLNVLSLNAILNIYRLDENIAIQNECGRRCAVPLVMIFFEEVWYVFIFYTNPRCSNVTSFFRVALGMASTSPSHNIIIMVWWPVYSGLSKKRAKISYRKTSNIRRTQFKNFDISRLVLQLYLPKPLKPCVKSRMKM